MAGNKSWVMKISSPRSNSQKRICVVPTCCNCWNLGDGSVIAAVIQYGMIYIRDNVLFVGFGGGRERYARYILDTCAVEMLVRQPRAQHKCCAIDEIKKRGSVSDLQSEGPYCRLK